MSNDYFNSSVQVLKFLHCPITMGGLKEALRTLMLVSTLVAACAPRQIPRAEIDSPSTPCTGQDIVPDTPYFLSDLAPYHQLSVLATERSALILTDYRGQTFIPSASVYKNGRARLDHQGVTAIVCRDKEGNFRLSTSFTHP